MAAEHVLPIPLGRHARPSRSDDLVRHRPCGRPTNRVFVQAGRPTTDGVTWLRIQADLDLATVAAARRELSAFLPPGRNPGIVLLHLGCERFVDLRGLRLLIDTTRAVRSLGGALAVVAPPSSLVRLLRLARLDDAPTLFGTAGQATRWAHGTGAV